MFLSCKLSPSPTVNTHLVLYKVIIVPYQLSTCFCVYLIGKGRYGVFDALNDRNQAALKALLEGTQDSGVPVTMKLRSLYQECLNVNAINALGAAPLLNIIKETGTYRYRGVCMPDAHVQ